MSLGTTQTLKSAQQSRVRIDLANRQGSARQNLGEGLMCPAGAGQISFDIFGRSVNQNTIAFLTDSACSLYTQFKASDRIQSENMERPYLNICAAGNRGAGDMLNARDRMPQNVYGEGYGGNFVRHYDNASNSPWERPLQDLPPLYHNRVQPWDGTMDATGFSYRG